MKKEILKLLVFGLCLLVVQIAFSLGCATRYAPPSSVTEVRSLLEWMGKPKWVCRYTGDGETFYEIGRDVPLWVEVASLASGAPSYTIRADGSLIGWSRDSGDVHEPEVVRNYRRSRKPVPVDEFMARFRGKSPAE